MQHQSFVGWVGRDMGWCSCVHVWLLTKSEMGTCSEMRADFRRPDGSVVESFYNEYGGHVIHAARCPSGFRSLSICPEKL